MILAKLVVLVNLVILVVLLILVKLVNPLWRLNVNSPIPQQLQQP